MKKKLIAGSLAVLLIAAGAYYGWTSYQEEQKKSEMPTNTVEVMRKNLTSTVSATGTIIPLDSVKVSSKVTARIMNVYVKENDTVEAGQTVVVLDGTNLKAQRDRAQFQVTNTKSKYERQRYLYEVGADTKAALEDAQYNYDSAQSTLTERESDLAETVITAPMSGIVVGSPMTVGTMALGGDQNPSTLLYIADLSKMQIVAQVDETDIGGVEVGQKATFTVDGYTGKSFTATVSKISQTDTTNSWRSVVETSSSSTSSSSASVIYYYVTLDVDPTDMKLLPAMTARIEIFTADIDDALAVPIAALKSDKNGNYVMVVKADGTEERRQVETGIYSDEYVQILDGLQEGEKLSVTYSVTNKSADRHGPGGM
ncbi:efflux RND transporter periplasmic adaptor subunit [Selenomonas sp. TAMA-11512]|uniref:efflux RND transporter periplasmic adaptor subunit n=1 Tax=Selenomonas sp. TAMA-11512 TaxID=3095337 RepID=UPI0030860FBC|nr:efflux RND transporter periplasmic adaptor subunit [Selenomonas sp. TAMA-11512]